MGQHEGPGYIVQKRWTHVCYIVQKRSIHIYNAGDGESFSVLSKLQAFISMVPSGGNRSFAIDPFFFLEFLDGSSVVGLFLS